MSEIKFTVEPLPECPACGTKAATTVAMLIEDQAWDRRPACSKRCAERLVGRWSALDLGKIWDILVARCGASADAYDRADFIRVAQEHIADERGLEYRFRGILGLGGKIWLKQRLMPWISYYPEDRTRERYDAVADAREDIRKLLEAA